MSESTENAPVESAPIVVSDGDQIVYIRENSGGLFNTPEGADLFLYPDEPVTVGEDVGVDFAARLVEDGVCKIVPKPVDAKPAAAASASKKTRPSADALADTENTAPAAESAK